MHLGFYKYNNGDGYAHRTVLKVIVNPILRSLQFWTDRPYVIASVIKVVHGRPVFVKYHVMRCYQIEAFNPQKYTRVN